MKIFDRLGLIFLMYIISFICFVISLIINIRAFIENDNLYVKESIVLVVISWITLYIGNTILKKIKEEE